MFELSTSDARPAPRRIHECLAGQRCKDTRVVDGKQRPAQTEKPDTLCRRCTRSVQSAIEGLPRDYVALHVSLGEASRSPGPRVRSSRDVALPIDKHKFALMTAISENLDRAAEMVSDALRCDPPSGTQAQRIEKSARMVATNVEKLLAAGHEDVWAWTPCPDECDQGEHLQLVIRSGLEFGLELRKLHQRTRAAVGAFDRTLRIAVPCGSCAAPFIFQNLDTRVVSCKQCGDDWTEELLQFAGRLSDQKKQENEVEQSERLQAWLDAEQLYRRAAAAETKLARLQRGFELATTPEFAELPAGQFAKTVLEATA